MTLPGYVPRPNNDLADRILKLEKRVRNIQQNVGGATVSAGGTPLSGSTPQPIGTATAGTSTSASHSDHVHSSTVAAQSDAVIASPTTGQGLVWNGTHWANQTLGYLPVSDLPYLVSGGGLGDYLRWADQISTIPRMAATGAVGSLQTISAVWPLPAGTSYSFTGIRYCLTGAATATASIGVYAGTTLSSLAQQGSTVTQPVTTGTNGVYQAAFSTAVNLSSASTQYVAVVVSFSAAQTAATNESTASSNAPWQTGAMWAGTAGTPTTIGSTFNASTPVATAAPWMALY